MMLSWCGTVMVFLRSGLVSFPSVDRFSPAGSQLDLMLVANRHGQGRVRCLLDVWEEGSDDDTW